MRMSIRANRPPAKAEPWHGKGEQSGGKERKEYVTCDLLVRAIMDSERVSKDFLHAPEIRGHN